jgi:hypothetical protein
MILLFPAALTPSGRPALAPGELERSLLDHVRVLLLEITMPDKPYVLPDVLLTCLNRPFPQVDLEFEDQGGLPGRVAPAYKVSIH